MSTLNGAIRPAPSISPVFSAIELLLVALTLCFWTVPTLAGTYTSAVTTFNWIDSSTHTRVGAATTPYKFNSGYGCGTSLPDLDDSISDIIPMGFSFLFGDKVFNSVRIQTNGRIQLVSAAIPWDNTTCGYGSPVTQLPIPDAGLNYTMRIYGNDLDPTPKRSGYTTLCADGVTAANNPCYVSFSTVGTAPNRSFVVTWKGVPEWVSSGAKGSYDLQIIVQENGEFVYQYGPYVAGPSATAGQIGYQVSSTDYDVPTSGFPAQNFAIRYFVPHPLVEYLMEQASWSGAGAVIDSSGSNKNGTPMGGVNTVAGAKVCRGADIPSNANTSNIDAIDSGVNVSTDIGSAGTIAFWYKAKTAWSGTGIQDAQLLDATLVNNQWFFVVRRSNGMVRFVVRDSTGTDRIAETAAISTSGNTWRHIAVTWNFNPMITANNNKLTVYVDGVQKAQTTFTSSTTFISPSLGSLYIGDNRSGYTGLNGTGRSADAVIDEVRIYNYELSQPGVASLMTLNSGCLDHYAISNSGSGTSCQVTPVTIASHTSTHGTFINNNLVTLSTSDGKGDWSLIAGHGALTPGPANSGTATYRFSAEYQAVLGLLHPVGTVTTHATDGVATDFESTPLTLTSTGCAPDNFNACHDYATSQCKASGRLYTRLAGSSFSTDVVALDTSGNSDTGFTGKAVVLLIGRVTPGAVDAQHCFPPDPGGSVTLNNAVTNFSAGRLSVNANIPRAWREARIKIVCDSTYCSPAGLTACSADNFAIRPGAVTIPTGGMATPPSATATPALPAGVPFLLTASTTTSATDNYAGTLTLDTSKLTAQIASQDTSIQSGGTVGTLSPATLAANQTPASNNATYSEAGYLYLAPGAFRDDGFTSVDQPGDCVTTTAGNLYLADGIDANGKFGCSIGNLTTAALGRFRPYAFDTTVTHACPAGGITYSGQKFPLKVTAKNSLGGTTANYSGSFANSLTYSDANGATGAFAPAMLAATSFASGVADLTGTPSVSFAFSNKLTAPSTLKLRVTEAAGASSSLGTEGTTAMRSGRLHLSNAFGSEKANLAMPVQAQYWSGSSWVINGGDSCTSIPANAFALSGGLAGNTSASAVSLTGGSGTLTLVKPNPVATGSVDVAVNLGVSGSDQSCLSVHGGTAASLSWLRSLNGSCAATYDRDPSARATFGIYSPESRKTVHVREQY